MGWNWPLDPHRLADTDWDAVCPNPILLMLLEAGHVPVVGGQYYRHAPQKHSVGEQLCGGLSQDRTVDVCLQQLFVGDDES